MILKITFHLLQTPLILSLFQNQCKKRLKFYIKNNYDINIIKNNIKEKYIHTKNKKLIKDINKCLID